MEVASNLPPFSRVQACDASCRREGVGDNLYSLATYCLPYQTLQTFCLRLSVYGPGTPAAKLIDQMRRPEEGRRIMWWVWCRGCSTS